jgi:hypothetical protein
MRVTICGPNLRDQSKGTFHVHAAGCADLIKHARREPEYSNGWTIEAFSRAHVCDEVYPPGDFECEPGEYVHDFHFFPCVKGLNYR